MHLVHADGRRRRRVAASAQAEDLPVRSRAVIVVGEDPGTVQFHAPDVVAGFLQECHVVHGGGKPPERGQCILHRRPSGLQERETAVLHDCGIVPRISVVRVGERSVVDGEVQEGEVFDDGGLHPVERQLAAVHVFRHQLVHDAGEHLRPQHHLQGDQQEQHEPDEGQHEVADDFQRFHDDKQR